MYNTLEEVIAAYNDAPEVHTNIWNEFTANVNSTPYLKKHRDYIEKHQFGYGDRPFHWIWKLLMDASPKKLKFLEIGVYQGQVLSLVQLIANNSFKQATTYGITPLDRTGDKFIVHRDYDYAARIKELHLRHGLSAPKIIEGLSFDPRVQKAASDLGPFDIVYIDGCHDYEVVVDDIQTYSPLLKTGGFLVVDDAANDLSIPDGLIPHNWRGLYDVTRAVNDCLLPFKQSRQGYPHYVSGYEHLFACGHNRIFRRVS